MDDVDSFLVLNENLMVAKSPLRPHFGSVPKKIVESDENGEPFLPSFAFATNGIGVFATLSYFQRDPTSLATIFRSFEASQYGKFAQRVVLLLVDSLSYRQPLQAVNEIVFLQNWTLLTVWTYKEAAQVMEGMWETRHGNADAILGKDKKSLNRLAQLEQAFGAIPVLRRTDAAPLLRRFGTVKGVMEAEAVDVSDVLGIGQRKLDALMEAFHRGLWD